MSHGALAINNRKTAIPGNKFSEDWPKHGFDGISDSGLPMGRNYTKLGDFMVFVQDPVCRQLICWEDAQAILRSEGGLIYLCSPACREKFLKHPERYPIAEDGGDAGFLHGIEGETA